MRLKTILFALLLSACGEETHHEKEDTRKKVYQPYILHKKNVNIALDDAFFKAFNKHAPSDFYFGGKCVNELACMNYIVSRFATRQDFDKNNEYIKKTLRIDSLFQYKENGLLVGVGNLASYPYPYHETKNNNIKIKYLYYRGLEKKNGDYYLVDRYYIFSIKNNVIKDMIACNLPHSADNVLHIVPTGLSLSLKEWKKVSEVGDYKMMEFYYYINRNLGKDTCRGLYHNGIKPEYPLLAILRDIPLVKAVYATVDKEGNIEIGKNILGLKSHFLSDRLALDTAQIKYNILPLPPNSKH